MKAFVRSWINNWNDRNNAKNVFTKKSLFPGIRCYCCAIARLNRHSHWTICLEEMRISIGTVFDGYKLAQKCSASAHLRKWFLRPLSLASYRHHIAFFFLCSHHFIILGTRTEIKLIFWMENQIRTDTANRPGTARDTKLRTNGLNWTIEKFIFRETILESHWRFYPHNEMKILIIRFVWIAPSQ